jgi:hypothetical protein
VSGKGLAAIIALEVGVLVAWFVYHWKFCTVCRPPDVTDATVVAT